MPWLITVLRCLFVVGFCELFRSVLFGSDLAGGMVCLACDPEKPGVDKTVHGKNRKHPTYCTLSRMCFEVWNDLSRVMCFCALCHMTVVQSLQIQKQPLRSNSMGFQYPAWLFSLVWIQCCHSTLSISFRAAAAYQNPLQFWLGQLWIASKCHCGVVHMSWKIMTNSQEICAFLKS